MHEKLEEICMSLMKNSWYRVQNIVQSALSAPSSQEPRRRALLHDERVSMHTGHQSEANCPPYGLCDLPLVHWS